MQNIYTLLSPELCRFLNVYRTTNMRPDLVKRLSAVRASVKALAGAQSSGDSRVLEAYRKMVEDTSRLGSKVRQGHDSLMDSMNKRDIMGATRGLKTMRSLILELGNLVQHNEKIIRDLGGGR